MRIAGELLLLAVRGWGTVQSPGAGFSPQRFPGPDGEPELLQGEGFARRVPVYYLSPLPEVRSGAVFGLHPAERARGGGRNFYLSRHRRDRGRVRENV